jgi:stage III sporulation protein AG
VSQDPYADASAYADEIEKQIEELCRGVIGAGDIKVFVSLKGGYRTVYAVDAQSSSSGYKSEVVMSGSGSGETPLVAAYENPEISGVGIVCSGGSDPNVRKEIIDLVSAALNISSNKIFVTSGE